MLRVAQSKSANAAIKYFREGLTRDDYYFKEREVKSEWLGKGAKRLELDGKVEEDDFVALGQEPRLRRRARS